VRILLVAATVAEIGPVLDGVGLANAAAPAATGGRRGAHAIDVLVTGVGMVATAMWCGRTLALQPYDLAINLGVCGSFDPELPPGSLVHVVVDRVPELGAEDGDNFLTIHDLQLLDEDEFPYAGGNLVNESPIENALLATLPDVTAITVNTAHGHDVSIQRVAGRFAPQVESMEGASFMYACLVSGTPFVQVRAVSNMVERRNRAAWKLPEAVRAIGDFSLAFLDSL
jgi:futalosine hydrolase